LGFTMKLLDIGGGFPGATGTEGLFHEVRTIRTFISID